MGLTIAAGCDAAGCDAAGCDAAGCDATGCDAAGCDAAGCDTAWNRTRVCSDASSTEMQCLRPLHHPGAQNNHKNVLTFYSIVCKQSVSV
jgi:hypothetical protein